MFLFLYLWYAETPKGSRKYSISTVLNEIPHDSSIPPFWPILIIYVAFIAFGKLLHSGLVASERSTNFDTLPLSIQTVRLLEVADQVNVFEE
jgi:hypothetical protein